MTEKIINTDFIVEKWSKNLEETDFLTLCEIVI